MLKKYKSGILAIIILAVLITSMALLSLSSMPASYVWVMDKGARLNQTYLVKMCSSGKRILEVPFEWSTVLGVDQRDGSVWAPESNGVDQIVHIDANGKILNRYIGYRTHVIAFDSNSGSLWVGSGPIVKLNSNGESLRNTGFFYAQSIAVDPRDGSIWIADGYPNGDLVHLNANGIELLRINADGGFYTDDPHQVVVDPVDGDVWYGNGIKIRKRTSTGRLLATIGGFNEPVSVSINPANGDVWVADYSIGTSWAVVRLDSDGKLIQRISLDQPPHIAMFNPYDGTVWVGVDGALLKLSEKGQVLGTLTGFTTPASIGFMQIPDNLMAKLQYFITCMSNQK